jgi:hypothetical protein
MLQAIKYSQSAIQQAAYHLLKQPAVQDQTQEDVFLDVDDVWRRHDEIPARITIALDVVSPARRLVLYNALCFRRHEIFTVFVSTPHVEVSSSLIFTHRSRIYPTIFDNHFLDIDLYEPAEVENKTVVG